MNKKNIQTSLTNLLIITFKFHDGTGKIRDEKRSCQGKERREEGISMKIYILKLVVEDLQSHISYPFANNNHHITPLDMSQVLFNFI